MPELRDQVVHHPLVVAVLLQPNPHGLTVELGISAEVEEILLPLGASRTLGYTGTHERDDETALARSPQLVKSGQITRVLVDIQDSGLLLLIEPPGFLVVEIAVAEVEGSAGPGRRDFIRAAFADGLYGRELLIVDDRVEAAVLAEAGKLFEGGFVIERSLWTTRHRSDLSGELSDESGKEVRGGSAGGGELRFQRVHQGQQMLHFGHDPALFGEGWDGNWKLL